MLTDLPPPAIHSSVLDFPDRGPWGKWNYRGNCSGHIQRSIIGHYKPKHFCDPSEGGGTSRDVCRDMGVLYSGLDLRDDLPDPAGRNFNLLRDKLRDRVKSAPDFIYWHPPYGNIVRYSGPDGMWGKTGKAHPDDLSNCGNGDDYHAKMECAIANIYDALAPNGHYSVLIGDIRQQGEYVSPQSDIIQLGIGKLRNVLIKMQHNCVSDRRSYSGSFIPVHHEYLLIFSKDRRVLSMGELLLERNARIAKRRAGTWKEIVRVAVESIGGRGHIDEVTAAVLERVDAAGNNNVEAKVRQMLQSDAFRRIAVGTYELAA